MKSKALRLLGHAAREAGVVFLPAAFAAGLFFLLPASSNSQAERGKRTEDPGDAKLCGEWHRGGGETTALDLGAVKDAYAHLKGQVERSLDRLRDLTPTDPDRPFDAGLPACREEASRKAPLDPEKGLRLRGRSFYFLAAGDPSRLTLPRELEKDPEALILLVRARSLKDLPEITRVLGRPVSLAGADFARSLGVRCANTLVKVSEKGDESQILESR